MLYFTLLPCVAPTLPAAICFGYNTPIRLSIYAREEICVLCPYEVQAAFNQNRSVYFRRSKPKLTDYFSTPHNPVQTSELRNRGILARD